MDCLFSAVPSQRNRLAHWFNPKYRCGDHYNSAALYFNEDITAWDTSSVTSMNSMFQSARSFNKRLGDWRVDKVTSMNRMFSNAKRFNRDLGWCVYEVNTHAAFSGTMCESEKCGVKKKKHFGTCDEGLQALFIILIFLACCCFMACLAAVTSEEPAVPMGTVEAVTAPTAEEQAPAVPMGTVEAVHEGEEQVVPMGTVEAVHEGESPVPYATVLSVEQ